MRDGLSRRPEAAEARTIVRRMIMTHWPDRFRESELGDDVALGEDGLGLDSIEIADVIVGVEDELGIEVDEELFTRDRLTIGGLATQLGDA